MTLLSPIPAVIAAAVGVPILLLLYFLKLRRTSVRVGSTMLWTQAVKDLEVNVPWRWLRFSWLLLLQLLGLLCLCVALGRPAINMPGGGGARTVIVIDRSASMSAADVIGADGQVVTRLDAAKARAGEIIDAAWRGGDGRVALAAFAQSAGVVAGWTRDRGTLREEVARLTPTDQPGSLRAAMDVLSALTPDASGESEAGRVVTAYVLSDGGFDEGMLPTPPAGVDLRFLRIGPMGEGAEARANQGIVSASARRDFDDPGTVRVTLRVLSTARAETTRTIRARLAGRDAGSTSVKIGAAALKADGEGVVPAESAVSFAIQDRAGGVLVLELAGRDALASDDRVQMVLDEAGLARVLLVAPGENGREASPFLTGLLAVASAEPHETVGRAEFERRLGSPLGFDGIDLVVLDRVEPARWPPVATLSLGAGGPGVVLIRAPQADRRERVVTWRRDLPVMRDVDLSNIELTGPATVDPGGASVTLAEGVRGPLIATLTTGAVRRVVCGPDLTRTTWGPDVSFVIFMSNAIDWLTLKGQGRAGRWSTTGQPVSVQVDPGVRRVELQGPGERGPGEGGPGTDGPARGFDVPLAEAGGEGQPVEVSLGVLERVGLYSVAPARAGQSALAVNLLDVTESSLATRATLTVGQRGTMAERAGEDTPREAWHWFVLAAAALLSLEWLVFAVRARL